MDMGRTTAAAWLRSGRTPTPNTMGGYYRHLESVFQPGDGPRGGRVSVLEGDEKRVVALPFVVKPYGRCCIFRAAEYESFLFEKRLISTRAEHKGSLTGLPRRRRSSARRFTPGRGVDPMANLKPRLRGFSLPS